MALASKLNGGNLCVGTNMEHLLARAKAGDQDAEKQLFQVLRARFMNIAKRRVWEKEEAEDVVQEACITVLQKYKAEEFREGFRAWAYSVLRMKIGNYLQSKEVRQEEFGRDASAETLSVPARYELDWDLETALIDCLRKIVKVYPRYARVLSLSYQGYKAEEICNRLQVTRANLYSLLSRSRAMLSKCLETGKV